MNLALAFGCRSVFVTVVIVWFLPGERHHQFFTSNDPNFIWIYVKTTPCHTHSKVAHMPLCVRMMPK